MTGLIIATELMKIAVFIMIGMIITAIPFLLFVIAILRSDNDKKH